MIKDDGESQLTQLESHWLPFRCSPPPRPYNIGPAERCPAGVWWVPGPPCGASSRCVYHWWVKDWNKAEAVRSCDHGWVETVPPYAVASRLVASTFIRLCSESTYKIFYILFFSWQFWVLLENLFKILNMPLCKPMCKNHLSPLWPDPQSHIWLTFHFSEVANLA